MGKREKKAKIRKFGGYSSSEEENRTKNLIEEVSDDDEANEDLSLKIVQKSIQQVADKNPQNDGVMEVVEGLKNAKKKRKKKEKTKRKKVKEDELAEDDAVECAIDAGFKDFCGELFTGDNSSRREETETEKVVVVPTNAVETNPVEGSDNAVLRKLLRGPRYFDPPESWGACYNCGKEGHTTVNCTAAKRKKPCFVCGSFEHNARQCFKAKDCFICKQHGHRAKDCPDKNKISKMCLKCGDFGHEMFSCRNEYCSDDLKEIQCYTCGRFGHLCCVNYCDSSPRILSCYRCGLPGHTGLACPESNYDANGVASASSCYKCGEEGHFARECTNSRKSSKRIREPSTPKQKKFSQKDKRYSDYGSAPYDLGKKTKHKSEEEFASAAKTKHTVGWISEHPIDYYNGAAQSHNRGSPSEPEFASAAKRKHTIGWIREYPIDYYNGEAQLHNHRSPSTPVDRRRQFSYPNGDYSSNSHSSKRYNQKFKESASNGYNNKYSASRFRDNSNDRAGRNYHQW